MTLGHLHRRTPIATAYGRRSTPSTGGTASRTHQAVQHGALTGARPLTPTQEKNLIDTVSTLGARAAPAVLLSVIAICRQYLTEPQEETVVLQTSPNPELSYLQNCPISVLRWLGLWRWRWR